MEELEYEVISLTIVRNLIYRFLKMGNRSLFNKYSLEKQDTQKKCPTKEKHASDI